MYRSYLATKRKKQIHPSWEADSIFMYSNHIIAVLYCIVLSVKIPDSKDSTVNISRQ